MRRLGRGRVLDGRRDRRAVEGDPQTVRNWIDRRELAAVRVGARRVRVRRSDLDRFLDAGGSADPGTTDELENLAELSRAAGQGEIRERASTLRALAAAAGARAARLGASPPTDT